MGDQGTQPQQAGAGEEAAGDHTGDQQTEPPQGESREQEAQQGSDAGQHPAAPGQGGNSLDLGALLREVLAAAYGTGDGEQEASAPEPDSVCISEGDEMVDVDDLYAGTARKRLLGMLDIREATQEVVEHQANSDDDVELGRLQKNLNGLYDAFVAKMGPISTTANSRVMRSDPTWPLLLALEIWDEEAETAIKADIFSKRTVGRPVIPDTVDSVKDALLISLALYGRIELRDMATRWRRTVKEVTDALREQALAFRDPQQGRWVPADEYLSGHIRDKIAQAKAAGTA